MHITIPEEGTMQILDMIVDAVKRITSLVWVLLTISVLLQVLGSSMNGWAPITNLSNIASSLSAQGLAGLVTAFISGISPTDKLYFHEKKAKTFGSWLFYLQEEVGVTKAKEINRSDPGIELEEGLIESR